MKNKHKLTAIIALLCMGSIMISGCTTAAKGAEGTAVVNVATVDDVMKGPQVELNFWHAMGGTNGAALTAMVDDFNTKYQDHIKVTPQFQGNYDEELNKLKSAQMANNGPNVIQIYELGTRFMIDSGWAQPVQNFMDADKWDKNQIEPNLAAYYTINNKLYSMPFNSSTPLLYYNKTAFKEAGLDPGKPPKTLEEIIAMSSKLKKTDIAGETHYAFGMYTYGWWVDQLMNKQLLPIFDNENGRSKAPTKVVFDQNGGLSKILKTWNRLIKEDVMPSYAMNSDNCNAAFTNGKIAMTVQSTAGLASMLTAVGNKFELGVGNFPAVDASSKGGVSIGGASMWIMKNKDSKVERATWEFVKYMVSGEKQAFWNTKTGYFPITASAYNEQTYKDNVAKFPQFETAVKQLRESPKESAGGLCAVYTQSRQIMEVNITKMLNKEQTEEQTLTEISKSINGAINDYNMAN